jgi:tensin
MVDVSNPGSESVIASVAEQLKSLQLTKANVVNFKASKEGLTVTDTVSGSFVKRFHPLQSISYCGLDPSDTRWEFDGLQFRGKAVSVKKARCFGFVWKPNERSGYMCALFGELEPSQPVAAIVHFVNKLLQMNKT